MNAKLSGLVSPQQVKEFVLSSVPMLTSQDYKGLGSFNEQAQSDLDRWESQGEIIAINHNGENLYPAFQFDEERSHRPFPCIKNIIQILEPKLGPWQITFWFTYDSQSDNQPNRCDYLAIGPDLLIQDAIGQVEGNHHG